MLWMDQSFLTPSYAVGALSLQRYAGWHLQIAFLYMPQVCADCTPRARRHTWARGMLASKG